MGDFHAQEKHTTNFFRLLIGSLVFAFVSISCGIGTPSSSSTQPTAMPLPGIIEITTTVEASEIPAKDSATETIAPQPSQTSPATSAPSVCLDLDSVSSDEDFVVWLNCILETGVPEELERLISPEGVMTAPSNQSCPMGDCWPLVFPEDLIPAFRDLQGKSIDSYCLSYRSSDRQLAVVYNDLNLAVPDVVARSFYREEDIGGYDFVFNRDSGYPAGLRWSMLISVIHVGMEEYRVGSSPSIMACP